jgi:hypothetical protein
MIHFTSTGYLHLKTPERSLMVPLENVEKTRDELAQKMARLHSQLAMLDAYLKGESTSDPEALR